MQVDALVDETPIELFMPSPNVSSVTVWPVFKWLPAESVRGAPLGRRSTGISKALRAELLRGEWGVLEGCSQSHQERVGVSEYGLHVI